MNTSIKTIVVTGGVGFVGTHLCQKLLGLGYKVISIDLRTAVTPITGVQYITGDVRNANLLNEVLANADAVYHLAATVSVPLCQNNPSESYSNNFTATLGVLEAIRKQATDRAAAPIPFVFASTAAVYASKGDDGRALSESDTSEEFFSYYAAQKHACEKAIELYARFYAIPATVFRFFNIYGPGQDPSSPYSGVITVFMKLAKQGVALPLNGGGQQTRDFISVHDIVNGCVRALKLPLDKWTPKPINLGTGTKLTVKELGEIINKLQANQAGTKDAAPREGDVLHSLANIQRARQVLQFEPQLSLANGLLEIL